jgi:ArsR family transcriptional regulator
VEDFSLHAFSSLPRLKLMICLGRGEKSVSELIEVCNLSQSAVSQHLRKLKVWNLVESHKEGRIVFYKLKNKKAAELSRKILDFLKK